MSRFVLLLYHGVTRREHRGIENCSRKHVRESDFAEQMRFLSERCTVLPLREILRRRREDRLPERSVAVTFDDGFENSGSVAFPILRRYGIPATFFLPSGHIGAARPFWTDRVEYLLNETRESVISLDSLKRRYPLTSAAEREEALREIKHAMKSGPGLLETTLLEMEKRSGVSPRYDYPDYRTLSWAQVRSMKESGLCDFGTHTVDHTILSHLPGAEQRRQIEESKRTLESRLADPVDLFAYPEGLESHYTGETVEILRTCGFQAACTAIFGFNTEATDPYHLRRNMVEFTAPFEECLEPPGC